MGKVIIDGVEYIPKEKEIETWTDPETGLVWERQGSKKTMSWKEALKYAKSLGNDWRLPTVQELFNLIDLTKINPACKITNTLSSKYWTSTTYAYGTSYAWFVDFYNGYVDNSDKGNNNYVRCVKGEKK